MADFSNIPEAHDAIRQLELSSYSTLPQEVKDVLDKTAQLGSSPVDRIVKTAEAIYAKRDDVPAAARETGAALFIIGQLHGWHGLAQDDRANRAAKVLRGDKAVEAPEVAREYQPDIVAPKGPMPPAPPVPAQAQRP